MRNRYGIPQKLLQQLFVENVSCAYCSKAMIILYNPECRKDSVTIEHLRHEGPFYWNDGLLLEDVVLVCGSCNSSRGIKPLPLWFGTAYCIKNQISMVTVSMKVQNFLCRNSRNIKKGEVCACTPLTS